VRKEFLQIVRDPSSIAIAFVMPIFLLVLFGYGVSLDADRLPVALVARNPRRTRRISSPAWKAAITSPPPTP
jgi:ABC-2 type transport system permease protein